VAAVLPFTIGKALNRSVSLIAIAAIIAQQARRFTLFNPDIRIWWSSAEP
jgi:hypothetical protein